MKPQSHEGNCHCQSIGFVFRTAVAPEQWPIRSCSCTFCRTRGVLSTSDPAGSLRFVERVPRTLHAYRFGQKTADFLICRNCGTYVGASMQSGNRAFGIVNARVLLSLAARFAEPQPMNYGGESSADRLARRESRWTPLELEPPLTAPAVRVKRR
ncbi:MAG TPA: hypothetical protein VFX89_04690 [Gammaproteobacteria bacterium]|nr:hypothetical protein [Gammaproteobacteria bacterium]